MSFVRTEAMTFALLRGVLTDTQRLLRALLGSCFLFLASCRSWAVRPMV